MTAEYKRGNKEEDFTQRHEVTKTQRKTKRFQEFSLNISINLCVFAPLCEVFFLSFLC
jgi:hypothetical protein